MPKYVKGDKEIYMSSKAYKLLYEEQGYLPVMDENTSHIEEKQLNNDIDDYSDDLTESKVEIDGNAAIPLTARVAMLSYEDLKAKAKELGIPKYANTKRDELVNLVVAAIEAQNA